MQFLQFTFWHPITCYQLSCLLKIYQKVLHRKITTYGRCTEQDVSSRIQYTWLYGTKTASPMVDFKQSSNEQAINQLLYQPLQSDVAFATGIYSILLS